MDESKMLLTITCLGSWNINNKVQTYVGKPLVQIYELVVPKRVKL